MPEIAPKLHAGHGARRWFPRCDRLPASDGILNESAEILLFEVVFAGGRILHRVLLSCFLCLA